MNNEPDYKDNLAFEPEMTKLDIAVKALEEYMTFCRHSAQETINFILGGNNGD